MFGADKDPYDGSASMGGFLDELPSIPIPLFPIPLSVPNPWYNPGGGGGSAPADNGGGGGGGSWNPFSSDDNGGGGGGGGGGGATTTSGATHQVAAPSGLNFRSGPSTSASKIGLLSQGSTVKVLGVTGSEKFESSSPSKGGWANVQAGGQTGYVINEWLVPVGASPAPSIPGLPAPPPAILPSGDEGGTSKWMWIGGGLAAVVLGGALLFGKKKKGAK